MRPLSILSSPFVPSRVNFTQSCAILPVLFFKNLFHSDHYLAHINAELVNVALSLFLPIPAKLVHFPNPTFSHLCFLPSFGIFLHPFLAIGFHPLFPFFFVIEPICILLFPLYLFPLPRLVYGTFPRHSLL